VLAPLLRLFDQHRENVTLVLCLLIGAAASFYLLGDLLGAWFHSSDDHNIVQRITPEHTQLSDWWDLWLESEVSYFGMSERYRPTLWGVQALEIIAFGADASAMYAVRILFFAVLLGALLFALRQATNWFIAAALLIYIANLTLWGDVFARSLVIPEAHAAGFFGVALIGITLTVQRLYGEGRVNAPVLIAALGMALAAGAKENFIFLAAPILALIVYALFRRRLSWWAAALCLVTFASPAAVAWTIYNYVAAQGSDFYGRDASPLARLNVLADWLPRALPAIAAMALALIGAFFATRFFPQRAAHLRKHVLWTGAIVLVAGAWWAWEIVFYNGDILAENNQRYGFPAVLIAPACVAAIAHLALTFAQGRSQRWILAGSALGAVAVVLAATPLDFSVRDVAASKAASTHAFHTEVLTAAALFNQHPDWPIIAEHVGFDAPELPLSAHVWLRVEGVRNPLFLRLHPEAAAASRSPFEEELWQILQRASADGTHGLTPFDQLDQNAERNGACYSLAWEGRFPDGCAQAIFRVPETPQVWRDGALTPDQ
jgi:hypothetical protein